MEADAYLSVYETLEQSTRMLRMPLRNSCPLMKIVWSSFDYMTGPELRFIWEATASASEPLSPVDLSAQSSRDDAVSLDESNEQQGSAGLLQFEEIDDQFRGDLLTAAVAEVDICRSCMRADCVGDDYCKSFAALTSSPLPGGHRLSQLDYGYLDAYMTESRSTLEGTVRSSDGDDDCGDEAITSARFRDSVVITQSSMSQSRATIDEGALDDDDILVLPDRDRDSSKNGNERLNGVSNDDFDHPLLHAAGNDGDDADGLGKKVSTAESDVTVLPPRSGASSFSPLTSSGTSGGGDSPEEGEEARRRTKRSSAMFSSIGVDSGIAGTISTHSDLSALCDGQSPPAAAVTRSRRSPRTQKASFITLNRDASSIAYDDSDGYGIDSGDRDLREDALNDLLLGDVGDALSDEEFVAKFALAELICSHSPPTDPLTHKLMVISRRQLVIGAYLFSAKREDCRRTTMAVSMMMQMSRLDWYLERRLLIESMMIDIVPRMTASFVTESEDELICRMTTAFRRVWAVLGALDRWPLCPILAPVKIRQTHLGDACCAGSDDLLARAVTALLATGGRCVVLGDQFKAVNKMMLTLSVFLPEADRWSAVMPFKQTFSPYLRLQAVKRKELPLVISEGVYSEWPLAVVDLDRRLVCMSLPYHRHRVIKRDAQIRDVRDVFDAAGHASPVMPAMWASNGNAGRRNVKLELRPLRSPDPLIAEVLQRMDMLPYDRATRCGYIEQLMLYWENAAHALINYIEDASRPQTNDKRGSAISSPWSLAKARKALDLRSDCRFAIVFAVADRLRPGFAEFVCRTTARS